MFGACGKKCRSDGECPQGSRCLGFEQVAGTNSAIAACVSDAVTCADGCPTGDVCPGEATCRTSCAMDGECLVDQRCVQGACVGTDPAHDPGPSSDGGPVDAPRPRDAVGLDAPSPSDAPPETGPGVAPYVADTSTLLLDHFESAVDLPQRTLGVYMRANACSSNGGAGGPPQLVPSLPHLGNALELAPPVAGHGAVACYGSIPDGSASNRFLDGPNGTVELWFYLHQAANGAVILSQSGDPAMTKACSQASFVLDLTASGQLEAAVSANADAGTGGFVVQSPSAVPPQTWTHVAVTWDTTQASLWVGSSRVAMGASLGGVVSNASDMICLGQATEAGAVIDVDELRISNVARASFDVP
jgi:hypothetical protein